MLPDAVFFDWDGTLVESLGFLHAAHNHVRGHFGLTEWSRDEFMVQMKYSSVELYPRIYGDKSPEAMAVLGAFMDANHLQNLVVMDGAVDLLAALSAAGVPMGVVSNKRHAFVTREVAHLGWQDYFRVVIGAGTAPRDKPAPDPLWHALHLAGLREGPRILFVGDTESDLLCAQQAGCRAAFLYHAQPDNPLVAQYNPAIAVENCRGLMTALALPGNRHKASP